MTASITTVLESEARADAAASADARTQARQLSASGPPTPGRLDARQALFAFLAIYALLAAIPLICKLCGVGLPIALLHNITFSTAIAIGTFAAIRRCSNRAQMLMACLLGGVAAFYVQLIDMASSEIFALDYLKVVVGATTFLLHGSPYYAGTPYVLYPPFYAESFSAVYKICHHVLLASGKYSSAKQVWDCVFYVFQNLQLLATLATVASSYAFCRTIGRLSVMRSVLIGTASVALSAAVFWTVRKYQANVFVTLATMLSILLVDRNPALAALAMSCGANIKIYPALLIAPWLFAKRFKACAWAALWMAVFIAGQFAYSGHKEVFQQYFATASEYVRTLPDANPQWLLGSPNLLNETFTAATILFHRTFNLAEIAGFVHVEQAALCLWIGWRFFSAPNTFRRNGLPDSISIDQSVICERACDLLSLLLIIGPTVLSDHYVLAIPIILWSYVLCRKNKQLPLYTGAFMALAWSFKSICPIRLEPVGLIILAMARRRAAGVRLETRTQTGSPSSQA